MQDKEKENTKRCKRCTLPDCLPSVNLDDNGICEHCKNYDLLVEKWEKTKVQKQKELVDIVDRIKRTNQKYDCLIPLSGGKDSTYSLYLFAKVYNLKCLCVTFDNGFLSEQAKKNIKSGAAAANADHIFFSINRNVLLRLYKLALQESSQFCSICMRGIEQCVEANRSNIPLIVTGNGARVDYLTFIPELFQSGDNNYFTKMIGESYLKKDAKILFENKRSLPYRCTREIYHFVKRIFMIPQKKLLKKTITSDIGYIDLYNYIDLPQNRMIEIIEREMGWSSSDEEIEHMDCLLHEMQHYVNALKFDEITLHTFHRSYLVRTGEITKEDALRLESEELKSPIQPKILNSFLKEIEMTKDDFLSSVKDWKKIDKFRSRDKRMDKLQ